MLEALIIASTNPQWDDRLFIELQVQNMLCTNCLFFVLTFKAIHVLTQYLFASVSKVQLNKYETAPNFIQLNQNLT